MPIFPLNTVVFPGTTVPLHVFEDRYRALVHRLLAVPDKADRMFGIVAIREGYEVSRPDGQLGVQSVHRVGCAVQLTSVERYPDGRFDIEAVGRTRFQLEALDTSEPYLVGQVSLLEDAPQPPTETAAEAARTLQVFEDYRRRLSKLQDMTVLEGALPRDPTYLSYTLAATCLLTLPERQALLETGGAFERLVLLRHALQEEMRAMKAVPSLPATQVARTGWSPN
jgi:Lon protease-like protein